MSTSPESQISGLGLRDAPEFHVLKPIGRGGYGEVYLVQSQDGRFYAVKVVYEAAFDSRRPYEREYEGIRNFEPVSQRSPNQLQIVHVGRRDDAGYFYYIMELADDVASGQTILPDIYSPRTLKSDLLRTGGRIPAETCGIVALALARALENLHEHGLVHRDIKPANIIFVAGQPKLADFGMVVQADRTVSCAGTEGYMPPEGPGSARADIYSLGMVLYEMCTGQHRQDFPRLPAGFNEFPDHDLLLRLNKIYVKACQPNLRKRFQSAQQMRQALEALTQTPRAQTKRLAPFAFALILVLAALVVFKWPRSKPEAAQAVPAKPALLQPDLSHDWTNSLGMCFVRVPGIKGLFGTCITRVQDYEAFATETKRPWTKPEFQQEPTHPAVNVSWADANAFCEWLTAKERATGGLAMNQSYRLPTDEEWSLAAGLGTEQGNSPAEKSNKAQAKYPWGTQWPPPLRAGNYSELLQVDDDYDTSPVNRYACNQFGIFDLGGNVWQWCSDYYNESKDFIVARGSSFQDAKPDHIMLSHRFVRPKNDLSGTNWLGFRCVLDTGSNLTKQPPPATDEKK